MEEYYALLKRNLLEMDRPVLINFMKADGSVRAMLATLNGKLIPEVLYPTGDSKRAENPEVQKVFDVEANGWRSFRWDNLLAFIDGTESIDAGNGIRVSKLTDVRTKHEWELENR